MDRPEIRVLIVDDSRFVRRLLRDILDGEPGITVVGEAEDPLVARQLIKELNPDVLTLDIEMPNMDGLAFLEKLMTLRPMPVLMISTLTEAGADASLRALELGAVDVLAKPTRDLRNGLAAMAEDLIAKVRAAARARVRSLSERPAVPRPLETGEFDPAMMIAVGASTGGVEALTALIQALPRNCPPMVIVQHMPAPFVVSFANRLNQSVAVDVGVARDGEVVGPGRVRLAPGDRHLTVERGGQGWRCALADGPLISGHRPSVDALFRSVAPALGARAVGIILTGMGRDGADGLLRMREAGAATIGEEEASCVVYGMPRAAREIGAVERELSLARIAPEALRLCRRGK